MNMVGRIPFCTLVPLQQNAMRMSCVRPCMRDRAKLLGFQALGLSRRVLWGSLCEVPDDRRVHWER